MLNYTHDSVNFQEETTAKPDPGKSNSGSGFVPPTIEEVYQVSGDTVAFFRACGRRCVKGIL